MDLAKHVQKKAITIDNNPVDLADITGPIPSYYFPIASYENLIEKVNELYRIKTTQQVPPPPPPPISPVSAADQAMQAKKFPPPHVYTASNPPNTVTPKQPE